MSMSMSMSWMKSGVRLTSAHLPRPQHHHHATKLARACDWRSLHTGSQPVLGAHAASATLPRESLLEALKKRLPGQESVAVQRLEQLKRNHMQYLSLDINWNLYKPEQREEFLRDLEDLVKHGYHSMTAEQKRAVSLANVESVSHEDFKTWDLILQKNEELQAGDWKNMSLAEKKAAYYLAFGPAAAPDYSTAQAVALRVGILLGITVVIYYSLLSYFRSKKELPTLTPEWKEASRKRLIENRSNPYTGESAHLFTKDGIKEA